MKKALIICAIYMAVSISLLSCGDINVYQNENSQLISDEINTDAEVDEVTVSTEMSTEPVVLEPETTVISTVQSSIFSSEDNSFKITDFEEKIDTDLDEENLDLVQKNSVAWLNYLALLTQKINSSANSRMVLEEAYSALFNNPNPENIDEATESQIVSLLDNIHKNRMIAVKRERLLYLYEQKQAKALKEAIPDPVALLSATSSLDVKGIIASGLYMTVDSVSSYQNYKNEIKQEYLKDGWELDDDAADTLHNSRTRAFSYMLDIVRNYNLPGEMALNENSIKKFVECQNNTNVHQQLQFLESNEDTYRYFGCYWLELAKCYYRDAEYQKCLDCVEEYEKIQSGIFRKDYEYAKVLPLAIAAASEVQSEDEYIITAEKYLDKLIANADEEWSLSFFASELYMDLYSRTNNDKYIKTAYSLALNNVNQLSSKQKEINNDYLSDLEDVPIPDGTPEEEKVNIEKYNRSRANKRKKELPEIYEPLALNCELLFSIADKIELSQAEKERIDGILNSETEPVFITKPVSDLFSFKKSNDTVKAYYEKDTIKIPAEYVSEDTKIKVTISSDGRISVYDDWKVESVERSSKELSDFMSTFKSADAKNYKLFNKNSTVQVEIFNGKYLDCEPLVINYKVTSCKKKLFGDQEVVFRQVK